MYRQAAWLLLALLAPSAQAADDVDSLPKKVEIGPPPRAIRPLLSDEAEVIPLTPLVELRHDLQKLRKEREALQEDRSKTVLFLHDALTPDSEEVAKLRLRLGSLLTTIGTQKATPPHQQTPILEPSKVEPKSPAVPPSLPPMPPQTPTPKEAGTSSVPDGGKTLEPFALAHSLFRVGNFQGALQAFRLLSLEGLKAEERAPLQYLMATCLRNLGKIEEAGSVYREVANSRGDEHLAACAQWQLNAMRWQRDMTEQLTKIRQRRLALEKQP